MPSVLCRLGNSQEKKDSIPIRAIFDSGSTHSFLTRSAAERASLNISPPRRETVIGIGGVRSSQTISYAPCFVYSDVSNFMLRFSFKVMESICGDLPPLDAEWSGIPEANLLRVTEELPRASAPVDLLLGNDLLSTIIRTINRAGESGQYLLWDTELGTALSGRSKCSDLECTARDSSVAVSNQTISNEQLYDQLKQFWNGKLWMYLQNSVF